MRISNDIGTKSVEMRFEPPPNYDAIKAFFPVEGRTVFFAHGLYVYSPSGKPLPTSLVDHEAMHLWRQRKEGGADIWWLRYLTDPAFRLEEEILAHIVELKQRMRMQGDNRKNRRALTALVASRLASPLYGGMLKKREAIKVLKQGIGQA